MLQVLTLALALTAPISQESAASVAFVGATVVPMDSERRLADQTLVVEGGRIRALGPRATTQVPQGALVIDASGKFLMPGLTDMHVHTWAPTELTLFLAHGVTTVRNMFGAPRHLFWRAQVEQGVIPGPTLVTAGPIVDGDPPVWPGSLVVTTADEARAAVGTHVDAGYDFIKVYNRLPAEAYDALIEEAALAGIPVDGHVPDAVGLQRVLAAGQRTIEHLSDYGLRVRAPGASQGSGWVDDMLGWQHIDDARMRALIDETLAAGTWLCPTLVVFQKWLEPEDFARELASEAMRHVAPTSLAAWRNMNASMNPELRAAGRDSVAGRMRFVKAFHDAGGRLILGTDMGNPLVAAGHSLHEELANLVAAGLTPYQALATGTRAPAECLGLQAEFGTLALGRRADLLLLERDPLADVANVRAPLGVMVRGHWLERAELARQLAALLPAPGSED